MCVEVFFHYLWILRKENIIFTLNCKEAQIVVNLIGTKTNIKHQAWLYNKL